MKVDEAIWKQLLQLKEKEAHKNCLGWAYDGIVFSEIVSIKDINSNLQAVLLKSTAQINSKVLLPHHDCITIPFEELSFFANTTISNNVLTILQNYWPLSVLGHLNTDLPYVFIHSAISLDGYLATTSGHSRWIGNDENLVHAHRLRALFDSILVGSKTVLKDKPSLNVRHVDGENPKRLILSNNCDDFSSLQKVSDSQTYLVRDSKYQYSNDTNHFDKILFFKGISKRDKMLDLLEQCKKDNIKSILIEGGGATLSTFIETRLAKNIQFHLSPLLFGSGIKAVKLPEVGLVNETHKLKNMCVTPIGNSFMITAGLA